MFTRPRIIPVLLIDDRDCIKTVQFGERTYLGDVVNAVKIFNRKGIDELAILDIGATKNHREPDFELLKYLKLFRQPPNLYKKQAHFLLQSAPVYQAFQPRQ